MDLRVRDLADLVGLDLFPSSSFAVSNFWPLFEVFRDRFSGVRDGFVRLIASFGFFHGFA